MDISKAFDNMWHEGVILKSKQIGIEGSNLTLLISYPSNIKHRVVLNGSNSERTSIDSGDPQGFVLEPLLYLVYINDLEET